MREFICINTDCDCYYTVIVINSFDEWQLCKCCNSPMAQIGGSN